MRFIAILCCLALLHGGDAFAACTVSNTAMDAYMTGVDDMGQSFTPTCTGQLISVSVYIAAGSSVSDATLRVYSGESVAEANLLRSQGGVTLSEGYHAIPLSEPVTVLAGQLYAFRLTNGSNYKLGVHVSNPYPGGQAYVGSGFFHEAWDAYFSVEISDPPAPTPAGSLVSAFVFGLSLLVAARPCRWRRRPHAYEQER
jgi:hypothetical protein